MVNRDPLGDNFETTDHWADGARPFRVIGRAALVLAGALLIGLVLPGVVAYKTGTFYDDQIVEKLKPERRAEYESFKARSKRRKDALEHIDSILMQTSAQPADWQYLPAL